MGNTQRTSSPSSFSARENLDDFGYGLDYDDAIMCDENLDRIVFHTGTFSPSVPKYTARDNGVPA